MGACLSDDRWPRHRHLAHRRRPADLGPQPGDLVGLSAVIDCHRADRSPPIRRLAAERGNATVEFALVAPILLAVGLAVLQIAL
ncbi:MAG: hypothetical protein F2702_05575, partial [Actinobacteria bacterium]|nr:hypothetical protein [Actinomycetota bacterium]